MNRRWRVALILICLAGAAPAARASDDVMALVHADRWPAADAAAATYLDPVARKLVTFYRMLAPNAASAAEIDRFMTENPDWPLQSLLARRRQEALATLSDDDAVRQMCGRIHPTLPGTLMRCAEAERTANETRQADAYARQAWLTGIDSQAAETVFMHRWSKAISPADQWQRFVALAWKGDAAAAKRQVERLTKPERLAAEAWLALHGNDKKAASLLAKVPASLAAGPLLMLAQARALRRNGDEKAALALWRSKGQAAQHEAAPGQLAAFWTERNVLARQFLQEGDARAAYELADHNGQKAPEKVADAEFLAGWIALVRLHDPATAIRHFRRLEAVSRAAITQGRAHYWLGRAEAAAGDDAAAHAEYAKAAAWPTTFYGQLAALALGDGPAGLVARIRAQRDPSWDSRQAVDFLGRDLTRAALLLVLWGEPHRAHAFLQRLESVVQDATERSLAAQLALGLDMPAQAVAIARRAGVHGEMLPDAGWPETLTPPTGQVDPAVTLGIIRQESSFDTAALSPAGALGLMQLMPATARLVGQQIGDPVSTAALLEQPEQNMKLGTAYLHGLIASFNGSLPLAIAAYNAGPTRVTRWLQENGDPRKGQIDMIDWIELIPFNETRNYVQRVIENIEIYRADRDDPAPYPLGNPVQQAATGAPAAD